jgi:hypothetical protein
MILIPTCRHLVINLSNNEFLVVLNSELPIISSSINSFSKNGVYFFSSFYYYLFNILTAFYES